LVLSQINQLPGLNNPAPDIQQNRISFTDESTAILCSNFLFIGKNEKICNVLGKKFTSVKGSCTDKMRSSSIFDMPTENIA